MYENKYENLSTEELISYMMGLIRIPNFRILMCWQQICKVELENVF